MVNHIIGAVFILTCSAIIATAGMFLSYGSGLEDNYQFVFCWVVGTIGAVIACRLP